MRKILTGYHKQTRESGKQTVEQESDYVYIVSVFIDNNRHTTDTPIFASTDAESARLRNHKEIRE